MPDFSKSKIYNLRDKDYNVFYVGRTTESLETCYEQHLGLATNPLDLISPEDFSYPVSEHIRKLEFDFMIDLQTYYPCCKNKTQLKNLHHVIIKEFRDKGIKLMNLEYTKKYRCACGGKYHKLTEQLHMQSEQHNKYVEKLSGYSTSTIKKSSLQAMLNAPDPEPYINPERIPSFVSKK